MLKFHIDLAEEAAKTLRANFLEANLKAVIYNTVLPLSLSDFLFLHLSRRPSSPALSPPTRSPSISPSSTDFQQPRIFPPQFIEQVQSSSNKLCCIYLHKPLSPPAKLVNAYKLSGQCYCDWGIENTHTHTHNNIVTAAYQLWNLQACFPRAIQVEWTQMHTHTQLWRVVEVCCRFWGIIPQVRSVHDNVPCNKTQESPVASLMPQEWVAGWMVMLVESGFTTFYSHNLTILLFFFFAERGKSPSSSSSSTPPLWLVLCLRLIWQPFRTRFNCVFSSQLFPFSSSIAASLFLCLAQSSHERSSFYSPFILFFYHPLHGFPPYLFLFSLHL